MCALLPMSPTWRPAGCPARWTPPHVSSSFRPRGFSPPRRLTPPPASGVLQPNRTRFAAFPHNLTPTRDPDRRCRSSGCPGPPSWPLLCIPNSATPLEEYHSPVAVPHHCGRCPLAVSNSSCSVSTSRRCGAASPLLPVVRRPSGARAIPCRRASLSTGRSAPGRGQTLRAHTGGRWLDGSPGHALLLTEDRGTPEDASRSLSPSCRSSLSQTSDAAWSRDSITAPPALSQVDAPPAEAVCAPSMSSPLGPLSMPRHRPRSGT